MRQTWGSNTLDFFYDESGKPYALTYNGTTYYYVTNLQGDVLHIVDSSGAAVVSYTYDPYGKPLTTSGSLASTLGADNPLRYRGYVYDQETGFYYLQSRYYDPTIGRFINADSYASTGQGILGHNMFAYCGNNPIRFVDAVGMWYTDTTDEDDNEGSRFVGAGIQLEFDYGLYTGGVELIVYWDVDECSSGDLVIALYSYDGRSIDMTDPLLGSMLATVVDNIGLLTSGSEAGMNDMIKLLKEGFSVSVSGVLIFGDESFNSVFSYEGSFTSVSGNIGRLKGSFAYASNCFAISVGCKFGSKKPT